jgi:hypothetical protein
MPGRDPADVGRADGHDRGDPRSERDPLRESGLDGEFPGWAQDRRDRQDDRQPALAEPAVDPPGDEEDRGGRDDRCEVP